MQQALLMQMDDELLGYHVYNSTLHAWLGEDEKRFTTSFHEAASFGNFETADAIMQRTQKQKQYADDTLYVLACMPSTG